MSTKLKKTILSFGIRKLTSGSLTLTNLILGVVSIAIAIFILQPESDYKTDTQSNSTQYTRLSFNHWIDADKDCLNTRHELLMQQSTDITRTGNNKCTINRGRWLDPYTGKTFYKASDVDVDHIVPLKWAWENGAYKWSQSKREKFANDPANLLVVENSVNRAKGAKGVLDWLPPLKSFHCQYVLRFNRVIKNYGLTVSDKNMQSLQRLQDQKCRT